MLRTLLLIPVLGASVIILVPSKWSKLIRSVALLVTASAFIYACSLLSYFDANSEKIQLFESHDWHGRFGSTFSLGVDGFSLPLVFLATLLMWVTVLASHTLLTSRPSVGGEEGSRLTSFAQNYTEAKLYYFLLLFLETAILGVFMARDWSLFYLFWELMLLPLFFLIERMGEANRQRAALNFVLYTMGGSVFMLIALLLLYDATPSHSFDMTAIAVGAAELPHQTQYWIFFGLLIGFGVKMPIFPLHGWLPLADVEAPSPVSILLSGILIKMGAYGLIRVVTTLPAVATDFQELLATLAFINLIYGAVLAWYQRDLKAMVAYASISHMGIVLLGIATLNKIGLTGAVVQMVAHGLTSGALFLLVGLLYERTNTRDIGDYSSLVQVMPRFSFFTVFTFMAAVGLPGTVGFVAELHVLIGSFARWGGIVVLLSVGMLISAAYALRTVGRLFTGPVSAKMGAIPDLTPTEMIAAAVLSAGTLTFGLFPAPGLTLLAGSLLHLNR